MELRHLRYFVTVAELLSFSKASRKLRIAQPALSRQIKDLETELGVVLLERSSRGVTLTASGNQFVSDAREILEKAALAMDRAREVASQKAVHLRLGYAPSPAVELLPRVLRYIRTRAPQVKVELFDMSSEEMLSGLRERSLECAIMVRPSKTALGKIRFLPLRRYPVRLAVAPDHPLASGKAPVPLASLLKENWQAFSRKDYPEYHHLLERLFASLGRVPRLSGEHDGALSLIAAIESGRGVAIVPASLSCIAGERVSLLALNPEPPEICVGLAYWPGLPSHAPLGLSSIREAILETSEASLTQARPATV